MSAIIVEPASVSIQLLGAKLGEIGMVEDPLVSSAIKGCLLSLHTAVVHGLPEQGPMSSLR